MCDLTAQWPTPIWTSCIVIKIVNKIDEWKWWHLWGTQRTPRTPQDPPGPPRTPLGTTATHSAHDSIHLNTFNPIQWKSPWHQLFFFFSTTFHGTSQWRRRSIRSEASPDWLTATHVKVMFRRFNNGNPLCSVTTGWMKRWLSPWKPRSYRSSHTDGATECGYGQWTSHNEQVSELMWCV